MIYFTIYNWYFEPELSGKLYNSSVNYITVRYPICSMYGIFTYICPNNHPNVGKYTIHGAYGYGSQGAFSSMFYQTW